MSDDLVRENARLRSFIEKLAKHGMPCDMCPTRLLPRTRHAMEVDLWWLKYLGRVGEVLKANAHSVLNPVIYEVRENGVAQAMFTGTYDECETFTRDHRLQTKYTISRKEG